MITVQRRNARRIIGVEDTTRFESATLSTMAVTSCSPNSVGAIFPPSGSLGTLSIRCRHFSTLFCCLFFIDKCYFVSFVRIVRWSWWIRTRDFFSSLLLSPFPNHCVNLIFPSFFSSSFRSIIAYIIMHC